MPKDQINVERDTQTSEGAPAESTIERGADGTITVHPIRGRAARTRALSYAAPGAGFALFWVIREGISSPKATIVLLLVMVPLFGLSVLWLMRYLRTNRITLTATALGHTGAALGRLREVPRESVARLVQVITQYSPAWSSPMRYLLVVGRDGRCLMRIDWSYYFPDDLRAIGAAMGVDYETNNHITPKKLCKEIPGAVSWPVRHPYLLSTILVVVILGGVFASVAITTPST